MSRITKEIASEIAVKMTEKRVKEIASLRKVLQTTIYKYALSKIPKAVLLCSKKHPDYFDKNTYVQFCGNGFNYESFSFAPALPINNTRLIPDDKTAKDVLNQNKVIHAKDNELRSLRKEIEVSLYNLRTYKNVEKEFPEAFKLLPKNVCTSLVINIESIREKLN